MARGARQAAKPLSPLAAEAAFEREIGVFRTEAELAAQFFYAFLAIHAAVAAKRPVLNHINTAPLFWKTMLGALQTAPSPRSAASLMKNPRTMSAHCCAWRRIIRRYSRGPRLRAATRVQPQRRLPGSAATRRAFTSRSLPISGACAAMSASIAKFTPTSTGLCATRCLHTRGSPTLGAVSALFARTCL